MLDECDPEERILAMLLCLILSSATRDRDCILATKAIKDAGLLDVGKLAALGSEEDLRRLADIIKPAGIHNNRARQIRDSCRIIRDIYDGKVPFRANDLGRLPGVGRKVTNLLGGEGFGSFCGIGSDMWVLWLCCCFGWLHRVEGGGALTATHAEALLRTFVYRWHYNDINKILGSFGQMFTQIFTVGRGNFDNQAAEYLVNATLEHIHEPYHLELLFFMIRRCRLLEANLEERRKAKKSRS